MRVLIADDDRAFAIPFAELVASCGHEVVEVVFSGLDAIRSYNRHHPQVVLMDYQMGRLNGLTACRNILSSDPAGQIVFLSGIGDEENLGPGASGAVAFLRKPVTVAELQQVLGKLQVPPVA